MNLPRVVLRLAARRDIEEALQFYLERGAYEAAQGWVDAIGAALDQLGRHPESGSPRYAQELNVPGLRHWPVPGFPCLVFYVKSEDHVDVWRVLHGERDIPEWLRDGPLR